MKTITRSELQHAQVCNNPPDIVRDGQGYHEWVGIGWIDVDPPFKMDPVWVIDDPVNLPAKYKKGARVLHGGRIAEVLWARRRYPGHYTVRYEDTRKIGVAKLQ